MLHVIKNNTYVLIFKEFICKILFNRRYAKGSLYGGGIFPFWLYIKFYGKPSYRFSRKLGLNKFMSLMVTNIPGSLFHIGFFLDGLTLGNIIGFIISIVIFPYIFYFYHKNLYRKI